MVLKKLRSRFATGAITAAVVLVSLCLAQAPAQAAVPGTPASVAASGNNTSAAVSWPPLSASPAVTSYTASAWTAASGGSLAGSCTTGTTNCSITGLTNGTTYFVDVTATNLDGTGSPTARISVTPATNPGPPSITGVGVGNAFVEVAFNAPASNGGSAILDYTVNAWSAPGGGTVLATVTVTSSPARLTGLTNGTQYFVDVGARNAKGTGPRSGRQPVTPATVPGSPTSVVATTGDHSVTISWSAPASNGGRPITGYIALLGSGPNAQHTSACSTSGALTCTIRDVPGNSTSYVDVLASNAVGRSPSISPWIPVTFPSDYDTDTTTDRPTTPSAVPTTPGRTPDSGLDVSPPNIVAFAPLRGPSSGGTSMTIRGTNFTVSSLVFIGGKSVQNLRFIDSQTLTATTRGGSIGKKVVTVRDPKGNAAAPATFRYVRAS
ncbi:MAG: fibronectin type III domain-containing protein [bacterium]|nr:fibronectin type III domain-containing protein [bacterium]